MDKKQRTFITGKDVLFEDIIEIIRGGGTIHHVIENGTNEVLIIYS